MSTEVVLLNPNKRSRRLFYVNCTRFWYLAHSIVWLQFLSVLILFLFWKTLPVFYLTNTESSHFSYELRKCRVRVVDQVAVWGLTVRICNEYGKDLSLCMSSAIFFCQEVHFSADFRIITQFSYRFIRIYRAFFAFLQSERKSTTFPCTLHQVYQKVALG